MLKKIFSVFLILSLVLTILPVNTVFAGKGGNIDGGESGGSTGNGSDSWKYTTQSSGVRLSIYWAKGNEESFKDSSLVKKLGNTTDFIPKGILDNYKVEYYTGKSIFDYMNGSGTSFSYINASKDKFVYKDTSEKVIADMPDPLSGDAEAWLKWFMGDDYKDNPDFKNIPAITKLCGYEISSEDFASGAYKTNNGVEYGWYKIFIEPEVFAVIDGNTMIVTLRDMIKLGETKNYTHKKIVNELNLVYEHLANPMYLKDQETAALNMYANSYSGKAYEVEYDINNRINSIAEIVKQLGKTGKIYKSMGVGTINPQRLNNDRVKVIAAYVKADIQNDGTVGYTQVGAAGTSYIDRSNLESFLASDVVTVPQYGSAYLNDIITSPIDLTQKSSVKNVKWDGELPENISTKAEIEPNAEDIWSYAFNLKVRLIYAIENGVIAKTDFDAYLDLLDEYDELSDKLKSANAADKEVIRAQMQLVFTEALTLFGFDDAYSYYKDLAKKPETAKRFLQYVLDIADASGLYSKATYIKDAEDIKLESVLKKGEDGVIYLRYIIQPYPAQKNYLETYKNGEFISRVEVSEQKLVSSQKVAEDGTIKVDVKQLNDLSKKKGYTEVKLVKWVTAKGLPLLKKFPTDSQAVKKGTTLTGISDMDIEENVYVIWRIDKKTPVDGELNVPEWRLSKYDTDMKYSDYASMSLKLTQDAGHKAYWSTLSPSGNYNYDTVNPNGKITTTANTPSNMKYSDWLHSKTKTKGSYSISHSNPNINVDVAGILNAIKSTELTGINIASWTVSTSDKGTLADYDLSTGLKSTFKDKENPSISKTDTLSYSIKNKDTYTHNYGYYSHYTVYVADSNPKDKIDDSYSYDVCNCTTIPETPSASYVSADYKIRVILDRYKATSNNSEALKVKAAKTEDNGKTTIAKQNSSSLTIYPEVPMLFSNDSDKDSIFFTVGTQSRKITLVDYHTLDYTAYVDATVSGTQLTDSRAKSKAKAIGLGGNPVFAKGTPLQVSYKVNESKNSKNAGLLTVKSYALDIDDDSLKSTWGNSDYSSKAAHTSLLNSFNNFGSGTATENLEIAVPNGSNVAYTGALVKNKLSYKEKDNATVKHTLIVRGGVLTEVDGKSVASIKANNKELYEALVGMKLVGAKDDTVLKTLVDSEGDKLTESTFATLANKERGVSDIATGKGWYYEDTTTLVVMEYITTYELPISMFTDKIPMTVKGLETPVDKNKFFNVMSKGYNTLNYTMTSKSISGLGTVKVYFEYNSRTDSAYGAKEPAYGVSNTTVNDSTFGGF